MSSQSYDHYDTKPPTYRSSQDVKAAKASRSFQHTTTQWHERTLVKAKMVRSNKEPSHRFARKHRCYVQSSIFSLNIVDTIAFVTRFPHRSLETDH